ARAWPSRPPEAGGQTSRHPGQAPRAPSAAKGRTSRIAFQTSVEAASSIISAAPKPATSLVSEAARLAADAAMPSSRSNVTARPGEARAARLPAAGRNTELGRCAAADTSKDEPSAAVM